MSIYGHRFDSLMLESFSDTKDIYYNKDKFDSGEINLCFITGLGGSGKSTMSRELSTNNIEHVEMDEVIFNFRTKDVNKFSSTMIKDFFKSTGKQYRKSKEELFSDKNYLESISDDFIRFSIKYANSHKNRKFIVDGVYIYWYANPSELSDYTVFIKGTDKEESAKRAIERDTNNKNFDNDKDREEFRKKREQQIRSHIEENYSKLVKFRNYFKKK